MAKLVFERKEIKYIITKQQHDDLLRMLEGRMQPDQYGVTRICNIYFDTHTFRLIRESIEKPKYKEKLRIRTYGIPKGSDLAFIEIKKKLNGVVYKRREEVPYDEAFALLTERKHTEKHSHIIEEIEWFLDQYGALEPAMVLCYDRQAFFGAEDPLLRMTMDTRIDYRLDQLDLKLGDHGIPLIDDSVYILELKVNQAMPLWFSHALDELKIYPGSYTKYGNAYKKLLSEGVLI